jgi:putative proteasome-type protease
MTYCLAIKTDAGLVFASDSRTNAGVDHVSTYSKMHTFALPNRRFFTLLSAGNLATTQGVVKRLRADCENQNAQSLCSVPDIDAAVSYVGMVSTEVQRAQAQRDTMNTNFEATFIFGGQVGDKEPAIFLVYPQGNYIHESGEHPFLQVGETKYGKPILDRVIRRDTPLELAARCALVSLNSTIRSNITVGPPVELLLYNNGAYSEARRLSLHENDPYYRALSEAWSEGLRRALNNLPPFAWEQDLKTAQFVQSDSPPQQY